MRKLSIIAAFVVAVAVIFGCKPSAQNNEKDAETADSTAMSGSETLARVRLAVWRAVSPKEPAMSALSPLAR